MAKRLLEAILAVAVEESVRRFLPPLLPYVWLTILLLLTWEILNAKPVKARVAHLANRLKGRHRVTAYVVAAVVSAALGIFYLWGIKHAFSYFGEPEAGLHATFKTELLDLSRNLNDAAMWVLYPSGYGSTISRWP